MALETKAITLAMPLGLGPVNCYLVRTGAGFVLIDTGSSNGRADLERELAGAGCRPGDLKLIIVTHGDFDHTGNCAYLRARYGARIAMHGDDSGMAERGDMFWNRKRGNWLLRTIAPILSGFGKSERFRPDLPLEDGYDLSEHGFEARVLHLPGHSKGSIGILAAAGDPSAGLGQALFCGDLFENRGRPALNSIMDDQAAAKASVERLTSLQIGTVYPGHGSPFRMELLTGNRP